MRAATSKVSLCALFCLAAILAVVADVNYDENPPNCFKQMSSICSESEYISLIKNLANDAKLRCLAANLPNEFLKNTLNYIEQNMVEQEQTDDCCDKHVKEDPKQMYGETPYEIMFGSDIGEPAVKKTDVIFTYDGKNVLINKDIRSFSDIYAHIYTLIVKHDNSYQ